MDGKLNRNFVPVGKHGVIGASEIMHNKSKLLMKKPKDFFLFGNKPLGTSIMDRLESQKRASQQLPSLNNKNQYLAMTMKKAQSQIENMEDLYVKGSNKFESEIEYGLSIPEKERVLIQDKEQMRLEKLNVSLAPDEVIDSHFDSKILY